MNQSQTDIVLNTSSRLQTRESIFRRQIFQPIIKRRMEKSNPDGISAIWAFETTERLLSIFKVKNNERT